MTAGAPRFDESMNLIYSNKYDAVGTIAARNDGHVMMTHSFTGTVDLGTGPITSPGTTTSMLLAELNENGKTHDAMALWANNSEQFPTGLDVDAPDSLFAGRIMVSGRYYTSSTFNWDLFAGFSSK